MRTATAIVLIALSIAAMRCPEAVACTTCHSKNPKMVRMHQELGFRDCFKCHYPDSQKSPEELKVQVTTDERCTNCHAKRAKDAEAHPVLKH
jgi:hypothetical protein